jgi:hypothetical protein
MGKKKASSYSCPKQLLAKGDMPKIKPWDMNALRAY